MYTQKQAMEIQAQRIKARKQAQMRDTVSLDEIANQLRQLNSNVQAFIQTAKRERK